MVSNLKWALLGAALLVTQTIHASGTIGGSAPRGEKREYASGKKIYMTKIACESCAMPGGVTDMTGAKELLGKLEGDFAGLSEKEKSRVMAYLKRRFKL
jgi:hypothetical protein